MSGGQCIEGDLNCDSPEAVVRIDVFMLIYWEKTCRTECEALLLPSALIILKILDIITHNIIPKSWHVLIFPFTPAESVLREERNILPLISRSDIAIVLSLAGWITPSPPQSVRMRRRLLDRADRPTIQENYRRTTRSTANNRTSIHPAVRQSIPFMRLSSSL